MARYVKIFTLEKAVEIARAAESTAAQMKVMTTESRLNAVKEKEQSDGGPFVNDSRIKDCKYCGRNHERCNCPAFGQTYAYCKRKNHFVAKCLAKNKVSTFQERFYLSTAGIVGHESREMVPLAVSKGAKVEVALVMDTGAECKLLPLDVYKKVTGDLNLNFLDTRAKSVLILANGYEQPIEGKATLYVTRKGNTHKIQVSVLKGRGYEPILSKESIL